MYYRYPTGSDNEPDGIDFAGDPTFDAVISDGGYILQQPNDITDVGVLSPYGTAGQGGNVWELLETELDLLNDSTFSSRGVRGGYWSGSFLLNSEGSARPNISNGIIGFRVASIPEPNTALLGYFALVGFLVGRRR